MYPSLFLAQLIVPSCLFLFITYVHCFWCPKICSPKNNHQEKKPGKIPRRKNVNRKNFPLEKLSSPPSRKKATSQNSIFWKIYGSSIAYDDSSTVGVPKIHEWRMPPCSIPPIYFNKQNIILTIIYVIKIYYKWNILIKRFWSTPWRVLQERCFSDRGTNRYGEHPGRRLPDKITFT